MGALADARIRDFNTDRIMYVAVSLAARALCRKPACGQIGGGIAPIVARRESANFGHS